MHTNIFRYQTTSLLKIWFLILVFNKAKQKNKCDFATNVLGILITIIFV